MTSSIVLEANQRLLGEGVGPSIHRSLNGNGAPVNLVAPGTRPQVISTATTVGVTAAIPAEIRGSRSPRPAANAIDLTSTAALTGSSSLTISPTFTQTGPEGIDINLNAGTTGTLGLSITGNTWTGAAASHAGNAVDINRQVVL